MRVNYSHYLHYKERSVSCIRAMLKATIKVTDFFFQIRNTFSLINMIQDVTVFLSYNVAYGRFVCNYSSCKAYSVMTLETFCSQPKKQLTAVGSCSLWIEPVLIC